MRKYYLICATTGYGNYHKPIYMESSIDEAMKIRNELQLLYDRMGKELHQNIAQRNVASIWEVEIPNYDPSTDRLMYQRKTFKILTNLHTVYYGGDALESTAKEPIFKDHGFKVYTLDLDAERKRVREAIAASDDDDELF